MFLKCLENAKAWMCLAMSLIMWPVESSQLEWYRILYFLHNFTVIPHRSQGLNPWQFRWWISCHSGRLRIFQSVHVELPFHRLCFFLFQEQQIIHSFFNIRSYSSSITKGLSLTSLSLFSCLFTQSFNKQSLISRYISGTLLSVGRTQRQHFSTLEEHPDW